LRRIRCLRVFFCLKQGEYKRMNKVIKIEDYPCGSGKTTRMIENPERLYDFAQVAG
jgi:hypothetical protein